MFLFKGALKWRVRAHAAPWPLWCSLLYTSQTKIQSLRSRWGWKRLFFPLKSLMYKPYLPFSVTDMDNCWIKIFQGSIPIWEDPLKEGMAHHFEGFSGGASGKEPACKFWRCKRQQVQSLGQEDPLRRKWQPTPVFLPGKSHGQRSLAGYSP